MKEPVPSRWRKIAQTIWTEPRHFFFWLTIFALLVLFTTIFVAAATAAPANWFMSRIVLAALLAIIIGFPTFLLAWIPPVRRLLARVLNYKLLVIAIIATLVALFYAIENWRGRAAWRAFQTQAAANGLTFDAEKIIPPEIPPALNMFEAAPWIELRLLRTTNAGKTTYRTPEATTSPWFELAPPHNNEAPASANLFLARRMDLSAWQNFYRGSNNVFETATGATTNYFPIAPTAQSPAQDVLLALSRHDERLAQLRSAAERPDARFGINYEDGFGALLPHLTKLKRIMQFLQLRATAELAAGASNAALEDILLGLRINRAIESEPILVSHLVAIAAFHISLTPIWEGLADHRWNDEQLTALERELSRHDFLANYHRAMAGERYSAIWTIDYLKHTANPSEIFELTATDASTPSFDRALGKISFKLTPSGWFEQNKAAIGRMHLRYLHPQVDTQQRLVSPDKFKATSQALNTMSRSPYDLFTALLLPALDKASKKFAIAQSYLDLARVAIALERYRLANGSYPTSLTALAPKYLPEIPHDIINGNPLNYSRRDDSFVLYSVGLNQTDDGGQVGLRHGKKETDTVVDHDQGDWVWAIPSK